MTRPKEWILVLNAHHARLVEGLAPPRSAASPERVLEAEAAKLSEVMSDKPGRSFSSGAAGRRSAMSYAGDPVRDAEKAFVKRVIEMVEHAHDAGEFDRLAVFAAPRVLGLLREAMPEALRGVISREVPRNLAGLDPPLLHEILREEMARDWP
ncbi:host attachment protein [Acidimangrovimonas sediminis]|uniref:host attachment protein n=1 Tax=Acidimangrovimonas sediminis TaxID=2056283 RepID=UPI001304D683|nr:host attachment protein [Acidimangrovimonas sediminis]